MPQRMTDRASPKEFRFHFQRVLCLLPFVGSQAFHSRRGVSRMAYGARSPRTTQSVILLASATLLTTPVFSKVSIIRLVTTRLHGPTKIEGQERSSWNFRETV